MIIGSDCHWKDISVRGCHDQAGLWTSLWETVFIVLIDMGSPSPEVGDTILWVWVLNYVRVRMVIETHGSSVPTLGGCHVTSCF